jgi:hypothetical protein
LAPELHVRHFDTVVVGLLDVGASLAAVLPRCFVRLDQSFTEVRWQLRFWQMVIQAALLDDGVAEKRRLAEEVGARLGGFERFPELKH